MSLNSSSKPHSVGNIKAYYFIDTLCLKFL